MLSSLCLHSVCSVEGPPPLLAFFMYLDYIFYATTFDLLYIRNVSMHSEFEFL